MLTNAAVHITAQLYRRKQRNLYATPHRSALGRAPIFPLMMFLLFVMLCLSCLVPVQAQTIRTAPVSNAYHQGLPRTDSQARDGASIPAKTGAATQFGSVVIWGGFMFVLIVIIVFLIAITRRRASAIAAMGKVVDVARKQASYQQREVERIAANLQLLAQGNLAIDTTIEQTDADTAALGENFSKTSANLDAVVERIRDVIDESALLMQAATEGRFAVRGRVEQFAGGYRDIIAGTNATLDTIVEKIVWYEAIIDAIPMPLSVTDMDMNWTFINKPVEQFLGVKREQMLGKPCNNWNANICKTENCGIARLRENKLQTVFAQQGMFFQVDTSYILNSQGQRVGHIEVVQDTTAKVKTSNYLQAGVQYLTQDLEKLANGNFDLALTVAESDNYTQEEHAIFSQINANVGVVKDTLLNVLNETNHLINASRDGRISERANAGIFTGEWGRLVSGINDILDPFEQVVAQMKDVVAKVTDAAGQVASAAQDVGKASQEVAGGAQQVAIGASEQTKSAMDAAANMTQLQRAIEEVTRGTQVQAMGAEQAASSAQQSVESVKQIAKTADFARSDAQSAGAVARVGAEHMREMLERIDRMRKTAMDTGERVTLLGASSNKIGEIVEAINDIADQTNLLALNAAIEAARAGEHGRGFAVVADEVRKLSERSAVQTKEIGALIRSIQEGITSTVAAMGGAINEVDQGVGMAHKASSSLEEILIAVDNVVTKVSNVSDVCREVETNALEVLQAAENVSSATEESNAATEEMAASSSEVTQAMERVAAVSEQASSAAEELSAAAEEQNALIEEMSAASKELAEMAEETRELLSHFNLATDMHRVTGRYLTKSGV